MHVDYHLVPYGKLNLDIKNVNCEGVSDTMRLRHKWEFDEEGMAVGHLFIIRDATKI